MGSVFPCRYGRAIQNAYTSGINEGDLVSSTSDEASATAKNDFAEMKTFLPVQKWTETVQWKAKLHERCMKDAKRGERPAKTT